MKKITFLFLSGVIMISLFSCGKEGDSSQTINSNSVKTYTEKIYSDGDSTVEVFNLNYDSKGRIISMISTKSPDNKFVYNYISDSKLTLEVGTVQNDFIHEDVFLRNSSLLDSTYQYNNTNDYTTEKYLYNSGNQLTEIKTYSYSGSEAQGAPTYTDYTYNPDGSVQKVINSEDGSTETFEYYTDLKVSLPSLKPFIDSPQPINLVKKHSMYFNGYLDASADVTYTFDSKNRITTITETTDSGEIGVRIFTYFD